MSFCNPPAAEGFQDACYNWPFTQPTWDLGPRRSAPREMPFREYDPQLGGWWQGNRKLHNFKPNYYFTRPHDGKRSGTWGRLKDVMTRQGPDVFVTISGDKRTLMRDRPQKRHWAGWGEAPWETFNRIECDKDWRPQDEMPIMDIGRTRKRAFEPFYNFRNRKFEHPRWKWAEKDGVWTDAHWDERHPRGAPPLNKRDLAGAWESGVPWYAGAWAGGRPVFA